MPRAPHVDSGFLADRPSFAAGTVTLKRAVLLALMVPGSGAAVMASSPSSGLKLGAIVVSVLWGLALSAHALTESVELRIWVDIPTCSVGVFSSASPLRTFPLMDRVPLSSSHGVIEVISTPGFWAGALSFSSAEAELCSCAGWACAGVGRGVVPSRTVSAAAAAAAIGRMIFMTGIAGVGWRRARCGVRWRMTVVRQDQRRGPTRLPPPRDRGRFRQ